MSISNDNTICLWDQSSEACIAVLNELPDLVNAISVVDEGRIAFGSVDGLIRLWDMVSEHRAMDIRQHRGEVTSLVLLNDGRLASCSTDKTIRLWDPGSDNGEPCVLFVADAAITALLTHPTRPLLVAGDASGRLHWPQLPSDR